MMVTDLTNDQLGQVLTSQGIELVMLLGQGSGGSWAAARIAIVPVSIPAVSRGVRQSTCTEILMKHATFAEPLQATRCWVLGMRS